MAVKQAITDFWVKYQQLHQQRQRPLVIEQDPDWPSPCEYGQADEAGMVAWQMVAQPERNDFSDMEQALACQLPEQVKEYYSSFYADNMLAKSERGVLQFLQVWNRDDFVRLQQNLVAHVLMKRRLKQRETVFFALTDEEDWLLSVLVESGEVVLERVGCEPREVLADSLESFIRQCEPHLSEPD